MNLWKYLNLLARPSLWERRKLGDMQMLWLKDSSLFFFPSANGVTLRDDRKSDGVIYTPNPYAHILLVKPLAIILNHRVP